MDNDKNNLSEEEAEEVLLKIDALNQDTDDFLDEMDKQIDEADEEFVKKILLSDEKLLEGISEE